MCSRLSTKLDLFGQSFSQRVDNGDQKQVGTVSGAMLSILLFLVLGSYSAYKVDVLVNKKGDQLTLMEFKEFYSLDETFSSEQGLSLAFAIITGDHFSGAQKEPLDESYGSFSATLIKWSTDPVEGQ